MFLKIMSITLSETILPKTLKNFHDLSEGKLFFDFIQSVENGINCKFLAKKIIAWFNKNQDAKKQKGSVIRFRGKESYNYFQNFSQLIFHDIRSVNKTKNDYLMQLFYESILSRELVSIVVRIDDINNNELSKIFSSGRRIFFVVLFTMFRCHQAYVFFQLLSLIAQNISSINFVSAEV